MKNIINIILVFLVFSSFNSCSNKNNQHNTPIAKKGILDLRNWNFELKGTVELNGEWKFYWNRLLNPDLIFSNQSPAISGYINVPGMWNSFKINNKSIHGHGFATYLLKLRLNGKYKRLALKINDASSAYTLWINNKIVAQNGETAKNQRNMRPQLLPRIATFPVNKKDITIIVQVSNYEIPHGGLWDTITIGLEDQIYNMRDKNIALVLFLFGILFIMSVYHFGLFLLRREELSALFFGIICLLFSVKAACDGERFIFIIFPGLSFYVFYKLWYLAYFLVVPAVVLFIDALFIHEMSSESGKTWQNIRIYVNIFAAITGSLFSLFVIIFPIKIYTGSLKFYHFFTFLAIIYCVINVVAAIMKRKEGSIIAITGIVLFFTAGINDMLNSMEIIQTSFIAPYGLVMFIFCQSFIMLKRFSTSFQTIATMSRKLRKSNEALLGLDKIKDEYLAKTSHELRTPLNGMIGLCDSMLAGGAGEISDGVKKNLKMISSSGRRLAGLISDILDVSKLKNNDIKLNFQAVDLKPIIDFVVEIAVPLVGPKKITIINRVPEDLPVVWADENRIQQVLLNLIGNSIKFTESGKILIEHSIVNNDSGKSLVEISIIDTGVGIPEKEIGRIFNDYKNASGTGLGLSISKKLIELHDGRIYAESILGLGAKFSFTIPIYVNNN